MKKQKPQILFFLLLALATGAQSQTVGNWNFNGNLTGTGTAHNSAGTATLGSAITSNNYNGGTVFFGEDGWPTGALDPNAYLEFSMTPNSGRALTLTYITLQLRRSTTGTSAGSGPKNWSLRSSVDGFATDIATGAVTNSIASTAVSLSTQFVNVGSAIVFRLYGYNTVVTTGGLNRFVFDNISATGTVILPMTIDYFHAALVNSDAVDLKWNISGGEALNSLTIERSDNSIDFYPIRQMASNETSYVDISGSKDHAMAYYRIKLVNDAGTVNYSAVQQIKFNTEKAFSVKAPATLHGGELKVNLVSDQTGNMHFSLYDMNGYLMSQHNISVTDGSQIVQLGRAPAQAGFYVLMTERAGKKNSIRVWVN